MFREETHAMKECFGILPLNQIASCHWTWGGEGWRVSQVLDEQNTDGGDPGVFLHMNSSSLSELNSSGIGGRIALRSSKDGFLPRSATQAPATTAWCTVRSSPIPELNGPVGPMTLRRGPNPVHSSCQNRACFPNLTLQVMKGLAISRRSKKLDFEWCFCEPKRPKENKNQHIKAKST